MPDRLFDVAVAGAGPAGMAAAKRAAECGASVALIDDNPLPGGQIWRGYWSSDQTIPAAGRPFSPAPPIELFSGSRIYSAPAPGVLALESFDGNSEIGYKSLILATGARERFLPFPGWTLPNIAGVGGIQALAKSGLPLRGKRIVIAGTGPLLLAVAKYLVDHGAVIPLIAEQAEFGPLFRFGFGLIRHPAKLVQAVSLRTSLARVRYLNGAWPIRAEGGGKIESVTLRQGTRTWSERCDYLACAFGLVPNLELPAYFGCLVSSTGVDVDELQQTSVPNIYAAGEVTGIAGVDSAQAEGQIAGYAAAGQPARARALFGARNSSRNFGYALENTFALRAELKSLAEDDTLICRCEDVALSRLRACRGWRDAKLHTRCGMGPCQGRVCGPAAEFLLGWNPESVRPPVFPARVGSLSQAAGK
jgi:NADPH-dependent 2,4-dienoyl-CoA reductase/sulfur reductase-like enzyme